MSEKMSLQNLWSEHGLLHVPIAHTSTRQNHSFLVTGPLSLEWPPSAESASFPGPALVASKLVASLTTPCDNGDH